jgi:hypothetical protein
LNGRRVAIRNPANNQTAVASVTRHHHIEWFSLTKNANGYCDNDYPYAATS